MNSSCDLASPLAAIVGSDPQLLAVLARVARVAPTRLTVLVRGESGTGKELIGRALHDLGSTPTGPFVAVNCGALPRELAESELFGHERGAFTGASLARAGWFEEAHGGTLVLDEIGELPLELQPKLLRVLETGRLRRVGGRGENPVQVRIVALTNRDLRAEAEAGRFRLDLYHRVAAVELELPPLRARRGDVAALARHFAGELASEVGGPVRLSPDAFTALDAYDWPGNVRELRNVLRRVALLTGPHVDGLAVSQEIGVNRRPVRGCVTGASRAADQDDPGARMRHDVLDLRGKTYAELQDEIFTWALACHGGSRRQAAQALGISRSTFCDRVKRLGIGSQSRLTRGRG